MKNLSSTSTNKTLDYYPLSSTQQEIWFNQILYPDAPLYNIGGYLQIEGPIDPALFEKALNQVIQDNDALRILIHKGESVPTQSFAENVRLKLDFYDFSDQENAHQLALSWMKQAFAKQFQLYDKPLFQFVLFKIAENSYYSFQKYHHLIVDGWAISLIVQRIAAAYNALATGEGHEQKPFSYQDFIQNDQTYLVSEKFAKAKRYWLDKYREVPEQLIMRHYAAAEQIIPSQLSILHLKRSFYNQLIEFAKDNKVSTFHVILGALYSYFSKTTGQQDIVIGLPILNRGTANFKQTVGLFTNIIPARFSLNLDLSFVELMQAISLELRRNYRYQRLPISEINQGLTQRRPLFDLMLSYEKHDYDTHFNGSPAEAVNFTHGFDQNALEIYIREFHDDMDVRVDFEYNLGAFDQEEIELIKARFEFLLGEILKKPDVPIRKLPIQPKVLEKATQRVHPTNSFIEFPKTEQSISQRFEQQVKQYPNQIAVKTQRYEWTYCDLNNQANQVAHVLLGQNDDERVALLFEHDAPMLAGIMGAIKAGKTYVPLAPDFPRERLEYIMQDSQVSAILTNEQNLSLAQTLINQSIRLINIDELENAKHDIHSSVSADSIAYLLYTSGSTGQPKGVIQNHRNVLHFIRTYTNNLHISAADKLSLLSSYSFDAAIIDIFAALLNGATLYPVNLKEKSFTNLSSWLSQQEISIYHSTPTVYRHWINTLTEDETFPKIRLVVLAGEAVYKSDVDHYKKHFSSECLFVNGLGSSESTFSLQYLIDKQTQLTRHEVPVGYPLSETEIVLLDDTGVETDIYGEIAIKSPYLALGYWQQPELTQAVFLSEGGRIYRSGDMGRLLPNGSLEFVGRKDFQVKLRGFRIELGEIETVLSQHLAIKESVVIVREESANEKHLVAYFVAHQESHIDNTRCFLQEKLPDYMIPSAFVQLKEMPLTSNGKIDRHQLSMRKIQLSGENFVAPRTPDEALLAEIWAEVLDVERVCIHDNFFEIGGHSLKATQVISRFHQLTGIELQFRELFQFPTIASLVQIAKEKELSDYRTIKPVFNQEDYPLTHAQKRLWVIHQMEENPMAYNMMGAFQLKGALDVMALEKALDTLVQRHEILRTTFVLRDGEPRQKIVTLLKAKILSVKAQIANPREYLERAAIKPFNLETGPLFKAELIETAPDSYILFFILHHIITDGWSIAIMVKELSVLYAAYSTGQENPLTELRIQYKDYTTWQNELLKSKAINESKSYWHNKLSGELPVLALPLDYTRAPVQTFNGRRLYFKLDKSLMATETNASLFMVLVTLVKILLYRYTGQEDIIVGSPIAGRPVLELEDQLGFYVNTLVLRDQIEGEKSFVNLLEQVKQTATEAYHHQNYPFDRLVEELNLKRDLSRSPLFDVMVVLQNQENTPFNLNGITVFPYELTSSLSRFDLTFNFLETESGIEGRIEYNTDLFREERIQRMVSHFQELIKSVISTPKQPIQALNILTEIERHKLLVEFNQTRVDFPKNKTVIDLFEQAVSRAPEKTAIVFEEQRLSYQELNYKANQLAFELINVHHIQPDDRVGIMLDRSELMVIAILGILKAGGAYVPIAREYPEDRRNYILEDSGCKVLLTPSELTHLTGQSRIDLPALSSDNLAYVIYTSGSTGKPKGCQIEHGNLYNYINWAINFYFDGKISGDFGLFTPLAFDFTITSIFCALLRCRTLYIYQNALEIDEILKHSFSIHSPIDIIKLTPAHISLLKHLNITETNIGKAIVGGEELTTEQVNILKGMDIEIINEYGPTETTVGCIIKVVEKDEKVLIGKPISNTNCYILDKSMNLVPLGIKGEICIGGAGVGRGYLNNDSLTVEKFIPSPFRKGERLYRTGDLGRWLTDGNVEFFGRMDEQIKIRGYRIECGEIEQMLLQHPSIQEVAVIAKDNELVGYIRSTDKNFKVSEIRAYLSRFMPDYMIPSWFVLMEEFPLTPNGKLDKKALPEPKGREMAGNEYLPASTEMEQRLVDIWEQILGREPIGINDNFFELGGDSIKAIQVMAALHQVQFKSELRQIFQYPTISGLAPNISPIENIDQGIITGLVPLTPIQHWFFKELKGVFHHYNHSVLLKARKRLDETLLSSLFQEILKHHDALRIVYRINGDDIFQENLGQCPLSVDLMKDDEPAKKLELYANQVQSGLDLEKAPLMRVILFKAPDADRLLIVIHHLLVDGISWRILFEDISIGYQQALSGKPIQLPLKTHSYKTWAESLNEYKNSDLLLKEIDYWRTIEKTEAQPVPIDNASGSNLYKDRQTIEICLTETETDELLTQTNQAYNTRLNEILLTVLARTLSKWYGGTKSLIALESHGRENMDLDISRTIGWFTSIFPIVLDISNSEKLDYQIKFIKETLRNVPQNGIGYGLLKYMTNREVGFTFQNKPQISFNYLGQFDQDIPHSLFSLAEESTGENISPLTELTHDLSISGIIFANQFKISVSFSPYRYQPQSIEKFLESYREEIGLIISHCQQKDDQELTPSDLSYTDLSLDELDDIMDNIQL